MEIDRVRSVRKNKEFSTYLVAQCVFHQLDIMPSYIFPISSFIRGISLRKRRVRMHFCYKGQWDYLRIDTKWWSTLRCALTAIINIIVSAYFYLLSNIMQFITERVITEIKSNGPKWNLDNSNVKYALLIMI